MIPAKVKRSFLVLHLNKPEMGYQSTSHLQTAGLDHYYQAIYVYLYFLLDDLKRARSIDK